MVYLEKSVSDLKGQERIGYDKLKNGVIVSTIKSEDKNEKYYTVIFNTKAKDSNLITPETYGTKEDATKGHKKWVNKCKNIKKGGE